MVLWEGEMVGQSFVFRHLVTCQQTLCLHYNLNKLVGYSGCLWREINNIFEHK
jgi:hypothetical protein